MVAWVAIYVARQKTAFMLRRDGAADAASTTQHHPVTTISTDDVASKVAKTVHAREANTPETDEIR